MNKQNAPIKVLVAMSGGVDSSVVAYLLKQKGYAALGVFMRLGVEQGNAEAAARRVCRQLGIKFYPFDISRRFQKEVINYFIDSYKKGITPNPCVNCNKLIKFGELFKLAKQLECDYLATGHYARLGRKLQITNYKLQIQSSKAKSQKLFSLLKGKDASKDQSYFLYNLTQGQLGRILFPLGDFKKEKIKKIASGLNLPNLKSESQDICFLQGDHNDFLKNKIKLKPGPIVLLEKKKEKVIGEHRGLPLYTVGQRRGVEIGGTGPYYVLRCDYQKNILYVATNHDDPLLYSKKLILKNINWIFGIAPKFPLHCTAVIRYRHKGTPCIVREEQSSALFVRLKNPERAITPGQSVVFYLGDQVLGGGVIV